MTIKKFGQEVYLEVRGKEKEMILDASGLRIDFDIRQTNGYNLATFTIYNLTQESVNSLLSDSYKTVSLGVSLHDSPIQFLATEYFVSNVVDEIVVPNRIVKLYCQDKLLLDYLEKPVEFVSKSKTLKSLVNSVTSHVKFKGSVEYNTFPYNLENQALSGRSKRPFTGNMLSCLNELGDEYNFNLYTKDGNLELLYKPNLDNVDGTSLYKDPVIRLQSNNMRTNPSIGLGSMTVVSNLDPRMRTGAILETRDLLTASTATSEVALQTQERLVSESINGYSRYQIWNVQHKGSNYTGDWHSIVNAYTPTRGKQMMTGTSTWFRS